MPQKYLVGEYKNKKILNPHTGKPDIVQIRAKRNCKKCYSRGFIGWFNAGGGQIKVQMCACFARACAKYADKHGIMLKKIKVELIVDEEKSSSKIVHIIYIISYTKHAMGSYTKPKSNKMVMVWLAY